MSVCGSAAEGRRSLLEQQLLPPLPSPCTPTPTPSLPSLPRAFANSRCRGRYATTATTLTGIGIDWPPALPVGVSASAPREPRVLMEGKVLPRIQDTPPSPFPSFILSPTVQPSVTLPGEALVAVRIVNKCALPSKHLLVDGADVPACPLPPLSPRTTQGRGAPLRLHLYPVPLVPLSHRRPVPDSCHFLANQPAYTLLPPSLARSM